jgi:hypothetical protein
MQKIDKNQLFYGLQRRREHPIAQMPQLSQGGLTAATKRVWVQIPAIFERLPIWRQLLRRVQRSYNQRFYSAWRLPSLKTIGSIKTSPRQYLWEKSYA